MSLLCSPVCSALSIWRVRLLRQLRCWLVYLRINPLTALTCVDWSSGVYTVHSGQGAIRPDLLPSSPLPTGQERKPACTLRQLTNVYWNTMKNEYINIILNLEVHVSILMRPKINCRRTAPLISQKSDYRFPLPQDSNALRLQLTTPTFKTNTLMFSHMLDTCVVLGMSLYHV